MYNKILLGTGITRVDQDDTDMYTKESSHQTLEISKMTIWNEM